MMTGGNNAKVNKQTNTIVAYMQSTLLACENISGRLYQRYLPAMYGDTVTTYEIQVTNNMENQFMEEIKLVKCFSSHFAEPTDIYNVLKLSSDF